MTKVDSGSAGRAEMSPVLLQLKRVASQPGFEDVGGARLVGVSDSANNEEYEILSVAIAEGDSIIKGSNRRFSPLPQTPDMESAPPNNQGGKRVNPSGKSMIWNMPFPMLIRCSATPQIVPGNQAHKFGLIRKT